MASIYDTANWIYKPNAGFKAGSHYMLKPLTGAGRVNVARASDKWCLNESGVLVKREANITPLDWLDGEDYSLIEPSAVTLTYNSKFLGTLGVGNTPTGWTDVNITTGGAQELQSSSYTGFNKQRINCGTGNRRRFIRRGVTVAAATYTLSVVVESYIGSGNSRFFNSNGTSAVNLSSFTGFNPSGVFPQRISTSIAFASAGTFNIDLGFGTGGNDTSATDNDEIIISGVQLELGTVPTSIIFSDLSEPTTRQADNLSVSNVAHLIGQTQGTVFVSANLQALKTLNWLLSINDGTTNNHHVLRVLSSNISYGVNNAGVFTNISGTGYQVGLNKYIMRYNSTEMVLFANGIQIANGVPPILPVVSRVDFGKTPSNTTHLNDKLGICWGTDQLLSDEFCLEYTA